MRTRWCTVRRKHNFRSTRLSLLRQSEFPSNFSRPGQKSSPCLGISSKKKMTLERSIMRPDLIIHNAKIATNGIPSFVEAIAVADGKVVASGTNQEILRQRGPETRVIDAGRRTIIPGLNDSHMHPI